FFRPPKGIGGKGVVTESNVLVRFGGDAQSTQFHDVALGAETMKDDEFWSSFLHLFPGKKREDARPWQRQSPYPGGLRFDEIYGDDGQCDVFGYVHSRGDLHVAIVFRLERGKRDEDAKRLIEMSLDSLAIGPDAQRMHRAYQEAKKHAASGKSK